MAMRVVLQAGVTEKTMVQPGQPNVQLLDQDMHHQQSTSAETDILLQLDPDDDTLTAAAAVVMVDIAEN
jgi:hypothetical protein